MDSEIFNKIGFAELQQNIERKVIPLAHKISMSDNTNYRLDPNDEEIKTMISEVLDELKSIRTKKKPLDR